MVDCKWNGGSRVSLGQKCELASGLMEITYDTGAKVILQGPVTYEVEANGGYLAVGKLTGKLEKKTSDPQSLTPNPFRIRTPTATVTDLGTEFGVEVDETGSVSTYVFAGAVRIAQKDGRAVHIAHAGDAVQVAAGEIRRVSTAETSKHFVRTIGEQSLNLSFHDDFTGGPSRRWISTYFADFSHNSAMFTDKTAPYRGYLRTLYSQYGTRDFVATVKLTNGDGLWGAAFFGIGDGTRGGEFGAPIGSEVLYMSYFGGRFPAMGEVLSSTPFQEKPFSGHNRPAGTTIGVQLTWTAATGTATFKLDTNNDGVYDDDTVTVTNRKFSSLEAPSRLFVGGGQGVIVKDFTVTVLSPAMSSGEPSAESGSDSQGSLLPVGRKGEMSNKSHSPSHQMEE